ncbi:MAG: helix-turn-helix transcriptional regulator [Catenulisporales bacterium]|jgi:transcriptional regulator with XRE-family HTH domain|nr:helix-turn-helix transcriptional regulator [Catenulisporales bacterium]
MPHNPLGALPIKPLGEYIREQRRNAQYSVRQLAQVAGVSNPYLSQIERGLRKPSAEILQQLAKALRISAETLYVRAGLLDGASEHDVDNPDATSRPDAEADENASNVRTAITEDAWLTARQKRALLDIYEAFRIGSAQDHQTPGPPAGPDQQ